MVEAQNAEGLKTVLDSLTVAEGRTAGYILSEQILPALTSDQYWLFFLHIVPSNSKAYLGTFLKAAVQLLRYDRLVVNESVLEQFSSAATPLDVKKFAEAFFSELRHADMVDLIVANLFRSNRPAAVAHLMNAGTPAAYFVLFRLLKAMDCDTDTLRSYVISLMKSDRKFAFNMASILIQYFDLHQIPGHFSLQIPPYELSRLDDNYESFIKVLKR